MTKAPETAEAKPAAEKIETSKATAKPKAEAAPAEKKAAEAEPAPKGPAPLAHRFTEYDEDGQPSGMGGVLTPGAVAAARATHLYDSVATVAGVIAKQPTTISTNTTTAGEIVDRAGYNNVAFFLVSGGTHTGITLTPVVQHGDAANLSDAADVPDAQLVGTEAGAALTAAGVSEIGYKGTKKFVRLSVVSTNAGSATLVHALAVLAAPICV